MVQYLETFGVLLLALSGVLLGRFSANLRKPYWMMGYVAGFVLLGVVILPRWVGAAADVPPFSWASAGRREFVVTAPAITILLTTALSRLPRMRQRVMVSILMIAALVYFSVLPFLLPAILQGRLQELPTRFGSDGVCRQGTMYTCGPAAAVTALSLLGIQAEEGEIAVLACSNPVTGTPPDMMCKALEERYMFEGLSVEYRSFDSLSELRNAGVTIVGVRFSSMADHYVTILDITDEYVILGDPLEGKRVLSHDEFEEIWRYDGIVLTKKTIEKI